ncbi:MAG TPA: hypothetical protein VKB63_15250 [Gemmatimonadales bacterium]|nr:hypothetical protein [Gemmatimonadales bacterium]
MSDRILEVPSHESPETTLRDMEVANQRLRRFAWSVMLGAIVVLGFTAVVVVMFATQRLPAPGSVVQARSFVLQDEQGRIRATWGVTKDGGVQLALQDDKGNPRARMSVLQDGSTGLALVDGAGHPRAALGLLTDGTINLVFADQGGQSRAVFGLTPAGASSIVLADGKGVTRAGLSVANSGRATQTVDETGGP